MSSVELSNGNDKENAIRTTKHDTSHGKSLMKRPRSTSSAADDAASSTHNQSSSSATTHVAISNFLSTHQYTLYTVAELAQQVGADVSDVDAALDALVAAGRVRSADVTEDDTTDLQRLVCKFGIEMEQIIPNSKPATTVTSPTADTPPAHNKSRSAVSHSPTPIRTPTSTAVSGNHIGLSSAMKQRLSAGRRRSHLLTPIKSATTTPRQQTHSAAEADILTVASPSSARVGGGHTLPRQYDFAQPIATMDEATLLAAIDIERRQIERIGHQTPVAQHLVDAVHADCRKWRTALVDSLYKLHSSMAKQTDEHVTMTQVLRGLHIDPQRVGWNEDEEEFVTPTTTKKNNT